MNNIQITFVGGDMRQLSSAKALHTKGNTVQVYGFDGCLIPNGIYQPPTLKEALFGVQCVVLPLPYARDGKINAPMTKEDITLEYVVDNSGEAIILGGKFDGKAYMCAEAHNIKMIDYYGREELSILNAVPTAEGAVEIAMRELPTTVFGMECAVVGYGKVGRVLAATLNALGANVTVFARRAEARAWAKVDGCKAEDTEKLATSAHGFTCVFNTVPAVLIDESVINSLSRDALIVDLASSPGGVDVGAAEKRGIRCISALSLPGRVAPDSAGMIIAETIENILISEEIIK